MSTAVVLLGTGNVGSALLARWARLRQQPAFASLRLVRVANSRYAWSAAGGLDPGRLNARDYDECAPSLECISPLLAAGGTVIDATASDEVAARHSRWLAQGLTVVTANKAGIGGELSRYRAIAAHAQRYGDSATVGAGLPLLRSVRELRAGGDQILGLAGVLSGSLAWLFNHYDGSRPFSELVREARARGYTEPDPRLDLSGQDVKRKLLALARTAGFALDAESVDVESLLPESLSALPTAAVDQALGLLDAPLRERFDAAQQAGKKLRFVARLDELGRARIGLESLAPNDPLAGGEGTDNRVAIWSCRYREQPLVVQGPGAGAGVTAAALLDDVLRLNAAHRQPAVIELPASIAYV